MKRFLGIALVVAALAVAATARAQYTTTNPNHVFTTIDSVVRQNGSRLLTGVLEGASAPTEVTFSNYPGASEHSSIDACERAANLMMNKPGQFKLEVWIATSSGWPYSYCRLSRVNP